MGSKSGKRKTDARINVISHILSSIPFKRIKFEEPRLGKRQSRPKGFDADIVVPRTVPQVADRVCATNPRRRWQRHSPDRECRGVFSRRDFHGKGPVAALTTRFITSGGRSAWFVGVRLLLVDATFGITLHVLPPVIC